MLWEQGVGGSNPLARYDPHWVKLTKYLKLFCLKVL